MSSLVDRIFSKMRAADAEAICTEQSKAQRALDTARQKLNEAKAAYKVALLDEKPEASAKARAAVSECELIVDRAEALVAALQDRFLDACESEAEAARVQQYEAAKRLLEEAEAKVVSEYPRLAAGLLKLFEQAAEAMQAVNAANESLPSGMSCIQLPPCFGGQTPPKAEVILSREEVEKWTFEASGALVGDERKVVSTGLGRGVYEGAERNQPVILRCFDDVAFHPAEQHSWSPAFFSVINLPLLDETHNALWRGGSEAPEGLLEDVRRSLVALRKKATDRARPVQRRLEPK